MINNRFLSTLVILIIGIIVAISFYIAFDSSGTNISTDSKSDENAGQYEPRNMPEGQLLSKIHGGDLSVKDAIKYLKHEDEQVRAEAVAFLAQQEKEEEAKQALLELFKYSTDIKQRRLAVNALARRKDSQINKLLHEALKDPSEDLILKTNILYSFGRLKYENASETIGSIASSQTEDKRLRKKAIEALQTIPGKRASSSLIELIKYDEELEFRVLAAESLRDREGKYNSIFSDLATYNNSIAIRIIAVDGLGRSKDLESTKTLIQVLQSDDEVGPRLNALEYLSDRRDLEIAEEALQSALNDSHSEVRRAARKILK